MKNSLLVLALLILSIKSSIADEYFPFVEFTCIPEADYLKIRADGFYNIGAYNKDLDVVQAIEQKSNLNYVDWQNPFRKSCVLGEKSVAIELDYRRPQATGMCGGEERASLSVSIDGLRVIEKARFQSACFSYAIDELDFSSLSYGYFKVCGRHTEFKPFKNEHLCEAVNVKGLEKSGPIDI